MKRNVLFGLNAILLCIVFFINVTFQGANAQTFIAEIEHPVVNSFVFNGKLVFVTRQVLSGVYMWISDGTSEGTYILREFDTDFYGDEPSEFVVFNDKLYFIAYDDLTKKAIWETDGSIEGTKPLDIDLIECHDGPKPRSLTVFNNYLYFYDGSWCSESIWRTDGNTLEKITPDHRYDNPEKLSVVGDELFFNNFRGYPDRVFTIRANNGNQVEQFLPEVTQYTYFETNHESVIFATSDTLRNQILQKYNIGSNKWDTLGVFPGESQFDNFTQIDDRLFFSVRNEESYTQKDQLYSYSQANAEATLLHTFNWSRHHSNSHISLFTVFKGKLFFRSGARDNYNLWTSDGTQEGTFKVLEKKIVEAAALTVSAQNLFFGSGDYESALWVTDGTTNGSKLQSTLNNRSSDDVHHLHDVNGTLYYFGDEGYGPSLWKNIPAAQLTVYASRGKGLYQSTLFFPETKVDSLFNVTIDILNIGNAPLYISDVEVIGKSFYISDIIAHSIAPYDKASFLLSYFPSSEGLQEGKLIIQSNDGSQGYFELDLNGVASGTYYRESGDSLSIPLNKSIEFYSDPQIVLTNNTLTENSSPESVVGRFETIAESESDYSISLTQNDTLDNAFFEIDDNTLRTKTSFDYEQKNTYVIFIDAINSGKEQSFTKEYVIEVTDEAEMPTVTDCRFSELPLSYALRDVSWVDEEEFIAVGEYGMVVKTENGGKNWEAIPTSFREDFKEVQMIGSVGYALSNKYLLKTVDEGESWFTLNLSSSLNALFFLTADIGFVVGERRMYKTTDGGKSWQEISISSENYSDVYFSNNNVGFVCGGKSFKRTTDGGATWQNINIELPIWHAKFVEVDFVDEQTGFLVATDGSFFRTTDGGNTWNLVTKVLAYYIHGMSFINNSIGYMYGHGIYQTEDGGESWDKVEPSEQLSIGSYTVLDMAFNPSASVRCMVGRAATSYGGGEDGRAILSYNNNSEEWDITSYQQDSELHQVSFLNSNLGFVLGKRIFRTLDGGVQWLPLNQPNLYNNNFERWQGGHFFNEEQVILIEYLNAYMTYNSGESWDTVFQSTVPLNDIFFIDDQKGFITGSGGMLFRTEDGGKAWSETTFTSNLFPTNLQFLDKTTGYLLIGNTIFKTTDGGLTWSANVFDEINLISSFHFFNEDVAILCSHDAELFHTSDGGNTWKKGKSESYYRVTDMQLISPNFGYACIDNNELLVTRDGGKTWVREYRLVERARSLYIKDETIYLVGKRNYVSKIPNSLDTHQPGYIYGSDQVAIGEKTLYSLKSPLTNTYQWRISGNNEIIYRNDDAIIEWQEEGTHTIQAEAVNGCGTSTVREYTVTVYPQDRPNIIGADSVNTLATNVPYTVEDKNNNRRIWSVQGHIRSRFANDTLWVDWGDREQGLVEVIQSNLNSLSRSKARLNVTIGNSSEVITSTTKNVTKRDLLVYPNSTKGILHILLPTTVVPAKEVSVRVVSLDGTIYLQETIPIYTDNTEVILDTSLWFKGTYIIQVTSPTGINQSQRIIKSN